MDTLSAAPTLETDIESPLPNTLTPNEQGVTSVQACKSSLLRAFDFSQRRSNLVQHNFVPVQSFNYSDSRKNIAFWKVRFSCSLHKT